MSGPPNPPGDPPGLRRVLSLPLLVLYGVGTMVGAGFYALLGEVAGRAGTAVPTAVILAAVVASFTALSFAQLAVRFPTSGGPARYVQEATGRPLLGRLTGLLVIFTGVVSAATLARAVGGFMEELHGIPSLLPVVLTVAGLCTVAAWGVRVSGWFAAAITILEVGWLLALPVLRLDVTGELASRAGELLPGEHAPWAGVLPATFLVFYAFVGFEDLVTLAEEAEHPRRDLPRAILGSFLVTTLLYAAVGGVAVLAVAPADLAASATPLALILGAYRESLGPMIVWVGVLAGLNGALIQIVMASRILHGLRAERGALAWLAAVHPRTGTPVRGTVAVGLVVLALATGLPLVALASATSAVLLLVFAAVNAALISLQRDGAPGEGFRVPRAVPVIGLVFCLALLAVNLATGLGE